MSKVKRHPEVIEHLGNMLSSVLYTYGEKYLMDCVESELLAYKDSFMSDQEFKKAVRLPLLRALSSMLSSMSSSSIAIINCEGSKESVRVYSRFIRDLSCLLI